MTQVYNQRQQILQYMIDHKEMTKADGWSFGCTKVDSRISELRHAATESGRRSVYHC